MFEGITATVPDLSVKLTIFSYILWVIFFAILFVFSFPSMSRVGPLKRVKETFQNIMKNRKKIIVDLFVLFALAQVVLLSILYAIDVETKVRSSQKLVIIEIDDFWNLQGNNFAHYGYSIQNYESVISIIEKYNYTATLGASPYIFVEKKQVILPLRDDKTMVDYLKKKQAKGHEIAMHGYAHCRNKKFCPDYEENYLNILQGKRELDHLFNQSTFTYLPPGNFWDDEQYKNVKSVGFRIIPNTHLTNLYWDGSVLITPKGYDIVRSWNYYRKELPHYYYKDWIKSYEQSDVFILQLHSNTFDSQTKLDEFDSFLVYLHKKNATVVTYDKAYRILANNK